MSRPTAGSSHAHREGLAAASVTYEPHGLRAGTWRSLNLRPNLRHRRVPRTHGRVVYAGVGCAGGRWNRASGPRAGRNLSSWWRSDLGVGLARLVPTTSPTWTASCRSHDLGHRASPRCGPGLCGRDCDVQVSMGGGPASCRRRAHEDRQPRLRIDRRQRSWVGRRRCRSSAERQPITETWIGDPALCGQTGLVAIPRTTKPPRARDGNRCDGTTGGRQRRACKDDDTLGGLSRRP